MTSTLRNISIKPLCRNIICTTTKSNLYYNNNIQQLSSILYNHTPLYTSQPQYNIQSHSFATLQDTDEPIAEDELDEPIAEDELDESKSNDEIIDYDEDGTPISSKQSGELTPLDRPDPSRDGASQWLKRVPIVKGKPRLNIPKDNNVYDINLYKSNIEHRIENKYQYRIKMESEYVLQRRIFNDKLHVYRTVYETDIKQARVNRVNLLLQQHNELEQIRRIRELRNEEKRTKIASEHTQHMNNIYERTQQRIKQSNVNRQHYKQQLNNRYIYGMLNYVLQNEYNKTSVIKQDDIKPELFDNEVNVVGWFPKIQHNYNKINNDNVDIDNDNDNDDTVRQNA